VMPLRSGIDLSPLRALQRLWTVGRASQPHLGKRPLPEEDVPMQLDPEPSPSLMTQRSWAAPSSPDGEAYSPPTTDADTIGDPAAATSTARLDDDETKATASESSAPGRSMSLRPKASCGPPVIPPEILEWARAPPKRRKTGKRKRARTWAEAKVKLNRLGLLKWGCPPLAPGTVVFSSAERRTRSCARMIKCARHIACYC